MATIKEMPTKAGRSERIGAHTHVRGLGLDDNLNAVKVKDGMVGQEKAREAAGLVVKMIKEGKLSGKSIILRARLGYSMSVTYDEKGKPVVKVQTYGDFDAAELRRDIEQKYPGARIEGLEKQPLIRVVGEEEPKVEREAINRKRKRKSLRRRGRKSP